MLQEGRSTQVVAEQFGVSRQAIDLHRRDFISRGILRNERAARTARSTPAADAPAAATEPPAVHTPSIPQHVATTASLDDLIDLVINAVSALRRLPELEAELDRSHHDYQKAVEELERLRGEARSREDQELRWRLAQNGQHGTPSSDQ